MNQIKKIRMKLGISQIDLATHLEVEQPFISAVESGLKMLSVEKLILTADYLGCTVDELLDREPVLDKAIAERLKKVQSLPKKQKVLLLQALDMLIAGA